MPACAPISVVIPHYNRSHIIGAALSSIRHQTLAPAEILVVDDGSGREHFNRLIDYSNVARIIRLSKNVGPARARNEGILAASGEAVAFLDDDDFWLSDKIAIQWKILSDRPDVAAVSSPFVAVFDDGTEEVVTSHSSETVTLKAALEGTPALIQTTLIRASVIRSLGGFDSRFRQMEDQEFWIRFAAAGYKAHQLKQPLVRLDRTNRLRLTNRWCSYLYYQLKVVIKHWALYETVNGPGAARIMCSKRIRRAGIRRSRILGRLLYALGCIVGVEPRAMFDLALTGRMNEVPYSKDV